MKRFKLIRLTVLMILKITFITSAVPQCNQLLTFIDTQFINQANNYESWFGNIRLPVNTGIKTPLITISLIFDHPVDSILSNYGTVLKLNSTLFRLVKRNSITNERNLSFEFFVRYNGTYPNLAQILINNVAQCENTQRTLNISKRSMRLGPHRRPKYVPDCSNEKFVRMHEADDDKNRLMATIDFYGLHLRNESIVNIAFDKKVIILGITKQTTSQTLDGHHFQILMPAQSEPKNPLQLKFFVKYNEFEMLPKITEVNINGVPLCLTPTLNPLKIERQPRAKKAVACLSSDFVHNYKSDDKAQRINAEIHINRNQLDAGSRVLVGVAFDRKVHHLGVTEYPTRTLDGKNFIVTINDHTKNSQTTQVLHVSVSFIGNQPKPKIIEIRINGMVLCGPESAKNIVTNNEKFQTTSLPNALEPNKFFDWFVVRAPIESSSLKSVTKLNDNCKFYSSSSVTHNKKGDAAERNEFPWHTAIYYGTIDDYIYICGGSLISIQAILTAGHCVTHKGTVIPLDLENFIVYFGLHSLRTEMGGEQHRKLSDIIIHPEYNVGDTYYSDIAIMKFDNGIEVTPSVQPICMWASHTSNDITQLYNRFGIIPGWGLNYGVMSENLTYTTMMVMPKSHCIKKKPEFYNKLLTGKSYCVSGYDKKSSVCNGDSGGGMVIPYDSSLRLRGIVSVSIKEKSATTCNSDIYPVFTDVAQFLPWIEQNLI